MRNRVSAERFHRSLPLSSFALSLLLVIVVNIHCTFVEGEGMIFWCLMMSRTSGGSWLKWIGGDDLGTWIAAEGQIVCIGSFLAKPPAEISHDEEQKDVLEVIDELRILWVQWISADSVANRRPARIFEFFPERFDWQWFVRFERLFSGKSCLL